MAQPPKPLTPRKLTAEQIKKVGAWIEEHTKGKGKGCPVCGHPNWQLADDFLELHPHYESKVFAGYVYPVVMLMCKNCTYLMMFHAIAMGAMETPEPKTQESKKDGE